MIFPPASVGDLATLLHLTERRVQQLAKSGITVKQKGGYDIAASIQGYVSYLQGQQPSKRSSSPVTLALLETLLIKIANRPCHAPCCSKESNVPTTSV